MSNIIYKSLFAVLLLFTFQGCIKYHTSETAPVISGYIYTYKNSTPKNNIKIGSISSNKDGYFVLPSSQSDAGDGFSISKKFDVHIGENIIKCTCSTIWPHSDLSCNALEFFIEDNKSAVYYFNASYHVPTFRCSPFNRNIRIVSLESKNGLFMISAPEKEPYNRLRKRIKLYFHKSASLNTINYEIESIYFDTLDKILQKLDTDATISEHNNLRIVQIEKSKVYDFFIKNEKEFSTLLKVKINQNLYPQEYQSNLKKIDIIFHKTLSSMIKNK